MQELEGSLWYSGALCMCWVVDWPARLATTSVFSSFWVDWHKARTPKILDNQTERTKSDGEPAQEYKRPGENTFSSWLKSDFKVIGRQTDHCIIVTLIFWSIYLSKNLHILHQILPGSFDHNVTFSLTSGFLPSLTDCSFKITNNLEI